MELKGKNVVIFGLGISGKSALELCLSKDAEVTVVNQGDPQQWGLKELKSLTLLSQEKASSSDFTKADYIILSPGIPRELELLQESIALNIPVINEIELALSFISRKIPIIAVTGTNGKTTTVSLIDHVLNGLGYKVFTGGNIGRPLCELVLSGEDVEVINLELSSFQLESIFQLSPRAGAILNIDENHGERYSKVSDYQRAKERIYRIMDKDGILVLGQSDIEFKDIAKTKEFFDLTDSTVKNILKRFNIDRDDFKMKGIHNIKNIVSAYFLTSFLIKKGEDFFRLAKEFKGVEHRLEFICQVGELDIYNDAKSTNWLATMTAVKSFSDKDVFLIVGGKRRGEGDMPHSSDIQLINSRCEKVFCFGESGKELSSLFKNSYYGKDLEEIFNVIVNQCTKGVLLFSPAYPSFDQYENYAQRGDHFKELVKMTLKN
ncbi:UDP-N-acetylmuramoyl-L-alanine--D-glutamate ligase [Bacteriovoracaceae bacterium]|nr:UDP-N-acetylmuramoyl-L-alanine--D-glutamate ligase [Bacteriovoracaceae bacterium]